MEGLIQASRPRLCKRERVPLGLRCSPRWALQVSSRRIPRSRVAHKPGLTASQKPHQMAGRGGCGVLGAIYPRIVQARWPQKGASTGGRKVRLTPYSCRVLLNACIDIWQWRSMN